MKNLNYTWNDLVEYGVFIYFCVNLPKYLIKYMLQVTVMEI